MSMTTPTCRSRCLKGDVAAVIAALHPSDHCAYLLFSRAQSATAELYDGVPENRWRLAETRLLESGHFGVAFESPDAAVLVYEPTRTGCLTP